MSAARHNLKVIELNHPVLADGHAVLASLSGGYKVTVETQTGRVSREGYDWGSSVFDEESTRRIQGVIFFAMGAYEDRGYLPNPNYVAPAEKVSGGESVEGDSGPEPRSGGSG